MKGYAHRIGDKTTKHIVPIIYSLISLYLISTHDTFEEWDGAWQLFAGERILRTGEYTGWGSHFWPPLYSLFLGIGSEFTSGFLAGKLISAAAAVGILYVAFYFADQYFRHDNAGVFAQLLVASTPLFIKNSFIVENHMLDALFVLLSLYYIYTYSQTVETGRLILAALFGGLASLTRYTSLILGPASILLIVYIQLDEGSKISYKLKRISIFSVIYTTTFFIVQSPWLYSNFIQNGSPLHTWQYMNVGSAVVPTDFWWWEKQAEYSSLVEIVYTHPVEYIENYLANFAKSGYYTLRFAGILSVAYLFVLARSLRQMKSYISVLLLSFGFGYASLTSQAFVFPALYLHISVLFAILSVGIIIRLGELELLQQFSVGAKEIVFLIILVNILIAAPMIGGYIMNDDTDGGQMTEHSEISQSLDQYDENIEDKYVMAVNPALTYYTGSKRIQLPTSYSGSLSDLMCYDSFNGSVKAYAKSMAIPPANESAEMSVDYIVLNPWFKAQYPEYEYLFDHNSNTVPESFEVVYQSDQVVVYDVQNYSSRNC